MAARKRGHLSPRMEASPWTAGPLRPGAAPDWPLADDVVPAKGAAGATPRMAHLSERLRAALLAAATTSG